MLTLATQAMERGLLRSAPMPGADEVEPEILVVDDDAALRSTLASYLSSHGYAVITRANGQEALLGLAVHRSVRLIVLDLAMPVLSGYEFLEQREADPRLRKIPVIVLSAEPEPQPLLCSWCLRLVKPTCASTLLEAVRRWSGQPRRRAARTGTRLLHGARQAVRIDTAGARVAPGRQGSAQGSES